MARDKLTEYSATASENTVCGDVNIAENSALPSDMNNFAREVMSHLKNFSDGTDAITGLTVDGNIKLDGNYPTGSNNVALGDTALDDGSLSGANNTAIGSAAMTAHTSGNNNTAVGHEALTANTTGFSNVTVGGRSLDANTTGAQNSALGYQALSANTTANNNTAVGFQALTANTTAAENTAVGSLALFANTTGTQNTSIGYGAGDTTTTGSRNTFVGRLSGDDNTTGNDNTAVGRGSLANNTTGSENVAIGVSALLNNTTASNNTAVGQNAGQTTAAGDSNVFIGEEAGRDANSNRNTFVGRHAGHVMNATGTAQNTFLGCFSGRYVTTGIKNTIIGSYDGNQGGVDIRTSNNIIVLSDGDGNPRMLLDNDGRCRLSTALGATAGVLNINNIEGSAHCIDLGTEATNNDTLMVFRHNTNSDGSGGNEVGSVRVTSSSTSFNTSSDHRLKENVTDLTGATTRLKQLNPVRFNFIVDADTTVDGFLAHEVQTVVPEAISGTHNEVDDDGNPVYQHIDQSKLVPLLVATIQELEARITALEAE